VAVKGEKMNKYVAQMHLVEEAIRSQLAPVGKWMS